MTRVPSRGTATLTFALAFVALLTVACDGWSTVVLPPTPTPASAEQAVREIRLVTDNGAGRDVDVELRTGSAAISWPVPAGARGHLSRGTTPSAGVRWQLLVDHVAVYDIHRHAIDLGAAQAVTSPIALRIVIPAGDGEVEVAPLP